PAMPPARRCRGRQWAERPAPRPAAPRRVRLARLLAGQSAPLPARWAGPPMQSLPLRSTAPAIHRRRQAARRDITGIMAAATADSTTTATPLPTLAMTAGANRPLSRRAALSTGLVGVPE